MPPQLKAYLKGALADVEVTWGLNIVTERPERGTIDNRNNIPSATLLGNQEWNITAAMNNEIIGGRCTLKCKVKYGGGTTETAEKHFIFPIRGKNPKDADVLAYINQVIDPAFLNIAKHIAIVESKQVDGYEAGKPIWRIYNQFNAGTFANQTTKEVAPVGTPNRSNDTKGWGIGQITTTAFTDKIVPTAVVWNWQANITEIARVLNDQRTAHNTCINSQRRWCEKYGRKWVDPPDTHTFNGFTFTTMEWTVMVLYNGPEGLPWSKGIRSNREEKDVQSPWAFSPNTGTWKPYDNKTPYARKVTDGINLVKDNKVVIKE